MPALGKHRAGAVGVLAEGQAQPAQAVAGEVAHKQHRLVAFLHLGGGVGKHLLLQLGGPGLLGGQFVGLALGGGGQLAVFGAELCPQLRLLLQHSAERRQGAAAAGQGNAGAAFVVHGAHHLDLADLAGALHVGAAAGAAVRPGNGDDAHRAVNGFFAAVGEGGQHLGGGVLGLHRQVGPDDAVGLGLGGGKPLGGDGQAGVQGGLLLADVEAHILTAEHPVQDAAEDVLAGVLLHTVQPVLHVQHALHGAAGLQGRIGQVGDDPLPGLHVQHIGPAQGAPVGRLAAALGEEGEKPRPVQGSYMPCFLAGVQASTLAVKRFR